MSLLDLPAPPPALPPLPLRLSPPVPLATRGVMLPPPPASALRVLLGAAVAAAGDGAASVGFAVRLFDLLVDRDPTRDADATRVFVRTTGAALGAAATAAAAESPGRAFSVRPAGPVADGIALLFLATGPAATVASVVVALPLAMGFSPVAGRRRGLARLLAPAAGNPAAAAVAAPVRALFLGTGSAAPAAVAASAAAAGGLFVAAVPPPVVIALPIVPPLDPDDDSWKLAVCSEEGVVKQVWMDWSVREGYTIAPPTCAEGVCSGSAPSIYCKGDREIARARREIFLAGAIR